MIPTVRWHVLYSMDEIRVGGTSKRRCLSASSRSTSPYVIIVLPPSLDMHAGGQGIVIAEVRFGRTVVAFGHSIFGIVNLGEKRRRKRKRKRKRLNKRFRTWIRMICARSALAVTLTEGATRFVGCRTVKLLDRKREDIRTFEAFLSSSFCTRPYRIAGTFCKLRFMNEPL